MKWQISHMWCKYKHSCAYVCSAYVYMCCWLISNCNKRWDWPLIDICGDQECSRLTALSLTAHVSHKSKQKFVAERKILNKFILKLIDQNYFDKKINYIIKHKKWNSLISQEAYKGRAKRIKIHGNLFLKNILGISGHNFSFFNSIFSSLQHSQASRKITLPIKVLLFPTFSIILKSICKYFELKHMCINMKMKDTAKWKLGSILWIISVNYSLQQIPTLSVLSLVK